MNDAIKCAAGRQISINGHELHVVQQGLESGQPVLFLHHGLGAARTWRDTLPVLAEAGYFAMAYDRWGYGRSEPRLKLDVPYFQQDLADLMTLIRQLGLQKTVVVGHSDGGTIALYLAACCPEMIAGLVTVAAHIYIEPKMVTGILDVRQAHDTNEAFRQGLRRVHDDQAEVVFQNWFDGWRSLHAAALGTWDVRPLLGRIECPTLVMQGLEDEHATPQHAQDIAAGIPGAELWLVAGAGHLLPQEQPEVFNARLLEFLKGV